MEQRNRQLATANYLGVVSCFQGSAKLSTQHGGSMKYFVQVLALSVLAFSAVFAQDNSFGFKASVRNGVNVFPVEVAVSPTSVKEIDIGDELFLEFTSPGNNADGAMSMVRLLRKSGDEFKVLHTAQQVLLNGQPRRNGYSVCGDRVTFISPAPNPLPKCNIWQDMEPDIQFLHARNAVSGYMQGR
jgi:hypothetical protein